MKSIKVFSPAYKNMAVNFDGFIAKFNVEGKATIDFEDKDNEKVEEIFTKHPNIYKEGVKVEKKEEKPEEQTSQSVVDSEEFNFMKAKNIELAKENALLKKQIEGLNEKIKTLTEGTLEEQKPVEEEQKPVEEEQKPIEEEKQQEEGLNIEDELNKKTVTQLKQILNADLADYKEEWKSLTKKDDIVKYILSKLEK